MLDEHLADGVVGEVGVDGLAAERGEGLECFAEAGVTLQLCVERLDRTSCQFRNALRELPNCILPVRECWVGVVEEELENLDQIVGLG